MMKDEMIITLLDHLLRSWLQQFTTQEIGSDVDKIRLLNAVRREVDVEPTPLVRQVYEEVFLRDVWTGTDPQGRSTGEATH